MAWTWSALKLLKRTPVSRKKLSLLVCVLVNFRFRVYLVSWYFWYTGKSSAIVFTALNRIGLGNYTHWPTGSAVTFNGWGTGEPAQFKSEHCGAFQ